jgi:hypothetical protein
MYSWGSSYNNVDLFGINNSDEDEEIFLSQQSTGVNEFFVDEYQNNEVSNEEENPVEEEIKENNNNQIRRDNVFKQVKIHSIKFVIDTINDIAEKENINSFCRLNKNNIKDDIKNRVQKSFNLKILNMTIREMLEVDDYNKGVIDYFEENIKNEKSLKLINGFLDKTLFEVIKIFNMSNEEYNKEFQSNNKFLLQYQKNIINKEKLIELINNGVKDYLEQKKERNRKID